MPLACILALTAALAAPPVAPVVLFDFDDGLEGWWGNPWGGGRCWVEPAPDPKFPPGALRVLFQDVEQGANGVGPQFPADAPWREGEWPFLSFWLRGQGEPCQVRFAILFRGPDDRELSFSRYLTITGTRWQRYLIPTASLFQRERLPFDPTTLTRLVFGGAGTCHYDVDQVTLLPPTHFLPLNPLGDTGPAPLQPRLEHLPGDRYELCFDPTLFPARELHVTATVAWPAEQPVQFGGYMPGVAARQEARIPLPGLPAAPGEGLLDLQVQEREGQVMYRGAFAFRIVLGRPPALSPGDWQLLPQPKSIVSHARYRPIPARGWGLTLTPDPFVGLDDTRLDLLDERLGEVPDSLLAELPVAERPEAYVLALSPDFVLSRGRAFRGVRWARATRDQLARSELLLSGRDRLPAVTVQDWPDLPVRGLALSLPTSRWGYPNDPPVDPAFFMDFLREFVVGLKYNLVVLMLDQGMELRSHPEISGPAAWSQQTVLDAVRYLRGEGVEVVPLLNSLGHADWINASHPELREDGDLQTLCTSHPAMKQVIGDIYGEILRLFEPRYFHIGMDECRWQTLTAPEDKRCKLCAGRDKAGVFAEQVLWLHDFFAERGVKTMMWGDMLLPAHNGGPPFDVAAALPRIPRDVVICDWSSAVDPLSLWYFQSNGFTRVVKSNSLGVSAAEAPMADGNMWGCWSKLPWLVENAVGYNSYGFLPILQACHYSWNLHPDVFHGVGLEPGFFTARPLALARHVLRPCRHAPQMKAWASDKSLAGTDLSPSTAVPEAGRALSREALGAARGRWLMLAVALQCSDEQLAAVRERLKDKTTWLGAPVAAVTFHYADGGMERATLNFGYHLRAAGADGLPYVYAGLALNDPARWYAVPIENPRVDADLREVSLHPDPALGALHLAAARLFEE